MAQATTTTTTNCEVKNSTSVDAIYKSSNNWQGGVGAGGLYHYPEQITSHGTSTFQHVGNQNGSQGAVVYRVTNNAGKAYDVVIAWINPPRLANKAYTLVGEAGFFTTDVWASIYDGLYKSGKNASNSRDGITSTVRIGDGNFPSFSAEISAA